jgi:hypothetical protein
MHVYIYIYYIILHVLEMYILILYIISLATWTPAIVQAPDKFLKCSSRTLGFPCGSLRKSDFAWKFSTCYHQWKMIQGALNIKHIQRKQCQDDDSCWSILTATSNTGHWASQHALTLSEICRLHMSAAPAPMPRWDMVKISGALGSFVFPTLKSDRGGWRSWGPFWHFCAHHMHLYL